MSQTESMRRLRFKGKIVGFFEFSIPTEQYLNLDMQHCSRLEFDSWDEGINLPFGKWLFAGDKIIHTWEETPVGRDVVDLGSEIIHYTATGTLRYDVKNHKGWWIECDDYNFCEWDWNEIKE